jgi:hypothetical protein
MSLLLFYTDDDGTPVPITATLAMVGALLRARTKDTSTGVELGTFTTRTRPTATEAQTLINMAQAQVGSAVGGEVPTAAVDAAQQAVALRAALLIEASYFPEQIGSGESPYLQLANLAKEQTQAVVDIDRVPGALRLV